MSEEEKTGGSTSDSPTEGEIAEVLAKVESGDTTTGEGEEKTGGEADTSTAKEGGEKEEGRDTDGGADKGPSEAEKRINEIFEEHDIDGFEELAERLKNNESLQEILGGDLDAAKEIVSEAKEMARTRAFWAQKKAEEQEANETPEETVERYKRENAELRNRMQQEAEDRDAIEESKRVIKEFDSTVTRTVNSDADLSNSEKTLLTLFLGVGNAAATVDPTDRKAVKQTLTNGISQFKKLLRESNQAAVDKYVAGKSDITPVSKSDTDTSASSIKSEREPLPKDIALDDVSELAKEEVMEILRKAETAG
jgi:hypothetical protein